MNVLTGVIVLNVSFVTVSFVIVSFVRFKNCIECERIVLHSFLTDHQVSSFRSTVLDQDFFHLVAENKRRMTIKETEVNAAGQCLC